MTPLKPEAEDAPESRPRSNRPGFLAVAKTIFFGLLMVGKKGTWETNGVGAQMTPGQIVVGAIVGGIVVIASLVLIVRIAIGIAGS